MKSLDLLSQLRYRLVVLDLVQDDETYQWLWTALSGRLSALLLPGGANSPQGAPPSGTSLGPEYSVVVINWEADKV